MQIFSIWINAWQDQGRWKLNILWKYVKVLFNEYLISRDVGNREAHPYFKPLQILGPHVTNRPPPQIFRPCVASLISTNFNTYPVCFGCFWYEYLRYKSPMGTQRLDKIQCQSQRKQKDTKGIVLKCSKKDVGHIIQKIEVWLPTIWLWFQWSFDASWLS